MDYTDEQIIRLLEYDARQNSGMIAKQINVSSPTVRRRLKRLIDDGELRIEAFRDFNKSGMPVIALIGLNIEPKRYNEVMTTICKLPEVSWVSTTAGRYEVIAFIRASSSEDLYLFLKNVLNEIDGIRDRETFLCLHIEKSKRLY